MDEKIARYLIRASYSYVIPISACLPALKGNIDEQRYELIKKIVGNLVADVYIDVINKIFEMYPNLLKEKQDDTDRYRRVIL